MAHFSGRGLNNSCLLLENLIANNQWEYAVVKHCNNFSFTAARIITSSTE